MEISVERFVSEVWGELSTIIGSVATATIFRRSISVCSSKCPVLAGMSVTSDSAGCVYRLDADIAGTPMGFEEAATFLDILSAVLRELIGSVIERRFSSNPIIAQFVTKEPGPTQERSCGMG